MEQKNRRSVPRVQVDLIATSEDDHKNSNICWILDLSTAGACMESGASYPKDSVIRIDIDTSEYFHQKELCLKATVVWVKFMGDFTRHGLFFMDVSDEDLSCLVRILKRWKNSESVKG